MIVRKLRLDHGLSQEQLAQMAGVSTRTLQRIERGAAASPESLKGIAAALDVDFRDLRSGTMPETATTEGAMRITEEERAAMEYVQDIKGFYIHLAVFGCVLAGLTVLNLAVTPQKLWVLWVALGWGVGVVSHALGVFEVVTLFGPNWEKRQIEKRLQRR